MRRRASLQPGPSGLEPYVSLTELGRILGFSRAWLLTLRKTDPTFPLPRLLGRRRIGWNPDDVRRWLAERAAVRVAPYSGAADMGHKKTS